MLSIRGLARVVSRASALVLGAALALAFAGSSVAEDLLPDPNATNSEAWSSPLGATPEPLPEGAASVDSPVFGEAFPADDVYGWHWLPTGLIYHSYMAGVHEPRLALFSFSDLDSRVLWDATLGGRVGLVQYGDGNPVCPDGFQLDFYGAAIARLDVKSAQDLDSTDYVFGFPITWGDDQWQWKFGYAHISSHLGDEFAISNPGALANRINYVRDSLVFGTSYYVNPAWRVYGEVGWAFHASGGAKPFESQFGTELSTPGPTDGHWVPFVAFNGRVRQDSDFCGDVTLQAGWLRRNVLNQTFRFGAQYYNGKSSQFEFFNTSEQQLGVGIWYDF
jgi:hypothetical protein